MTTPGPRTLRIERHERGVVTGADVLTDDQTEVINKDLIIATMTDDVPLNIELTVRMGRGYLAATEQAEREPEVGVIPLDAAYSPVTRVRYKIEDTRVGQRTNYDKLNLEVWTNGTVTPEMAVVESAKILRKHLNPFISYREPGPGAAARRGPAGHARSDRLRAGRPGTRGEAGAVAGRAQPFGPRRPTASSRKGSTRSATW